MPQYYPHDRIRELTRWRLERIVRSVRDLLFREPDAPWDADTFDAIVDVLRAHELLPPSADQPSIHPHRPDLEESP